MNEIIPMDGYEFINSGRVITDDIIYYCDGITKILREIKKPIEPTTSIHTTQDELDPMEVYDRVRKWSIRHFVDGESTETTVQCTTIKRAYELAIRAGLGDESITSITEVTR